MPFLPASIIFNLAVAVERPLLAPIIKLQMAIFLMVCAIVIPFILSLVRSYQRRLDALDAIAWRSPVLTRFVWGAARASLTFLNAQTQDIVIVRSS